MHWVSLAILLATFPIVAQAQKRNTELLIQSNPNCMLCVNEIKNEFAGVKGVRSVEVDTTNQTVRFVFHSGKIKGDSLRTILNQLGYDVDGKPGVGKKSKSLHDPKP